MIDLIVTKQLHEMPEYVSIEEQLLLDAKKFMDRAQMYLNAGKVAHCAGCLAKAAKKMHRAQEMKLSLDGLSEALMQPMILEMLKQIDAKILKS